MQLFTYAMIREKAADACYPMELTGDDALLVESIVNQGIDGHLEACFLQDLDQYVWATTFSTQKLVVRKLDCRVSPQSLPVLLRRLWEVGLKDEPEAANAEALCSDILNTLGFTDLECGYEIVCPADEKGTEGDEGTDLES